MILVLFFQGLYIMDALYNEVGASLGSLPYLPLTLDVACSFNDYRYNL
jgi:hypothetical protein